MTTEQTSCHCWWEFSPTDPRTKHRSGCPLYTPKAMITLKELVEQVNEQMLHYAWLAAEARSWGWPEIEWPEPKPLPWHDMRLNVAPVRREFL